MAKMTMAKLNEVLAKGCRDALSDFFDDGITTFVKQGDGSRLNASAYMDGETSNTGKILIRGYKNLKSKQFKKIDAEYYALADGPCGIFAGTKERKLRYKKDLEELVKVSQQ